MNGDAAAAPRVEAADHGADQGTPQGWRNREGPTLRGRETTAAKLLPPASSAAVRKRAVVIFQATARLEAEPIQRSCCLGRAEEPAKGSLAEKAALRRNSAAAIEQQAASAPRKQQVPTAIGANFLDRKVEKLQQHN